jgi:GTP-binding protein
MRGGFIDEAHIEVKAGDGGNGCFAYERLKYKPRGKPSGGNGGRGGNVYVQASDHIATLRDVSYKKTYTAGRGQHGGGANKHGRSGDDVEVHVPPGTLVYDEETGALLADCCHDDKPVCVARGGRGGLGNAALHSPRNPDPDECQPGRKGEHRSLRFELKVLADVGLVGRPNAGKSTFISRVSNARPRIAGYPFTTLRPHLGIVSLSDRRKGFVIADIPGLVENAHEGRGMGIRFLRHIERTRVVAVMVEATSDDPRGDARVLCNELAHYSTLLADKPVCHVLTKADLLTEADREKAMALPGDWHVISSVSGEGVPQLLQHLSVLVHRAGYDDKTAHQGRPVSRGE